MAASLDRESLRCSICLELFRNPAIIPCGHSFCADCIAGLWDQDVCRCPRCKQTFTHRPALIDWLQVKELSEKLMKTRTQAEGEAEARGDVSCDSCTSRTTKATRSCLTCLASYCNTHLERHNELHGWRKHQLTDATDLQSITCSQHGKLTDVFCRTDQLCVCVLCAMHEHKGHDTISASEERADRQGKLMETRVKFLQDIQDREKDFKELTQAEESIRRSSQTADTESERIFSEVLGCVQKTCCRVKELIAAQQRAELSRVEGLKEKVQQKISDMKMKVSELDQFMTTEDHILFLQNYPSDCGESISEEFSSISEHPDAFFDNARMLITKMQERLMDVTKTTEIEIKIKSVKASPPVGATMKQSATPAFAPVFRFGEPVPGFNFSLQYVPSKSSSVLNQSGASATDDEETFKPSMSRTYAPAAPLPDLIEISTGEENERVVFSHRAKLYLYDKESLEWKDRGVGKLKILQNDKARRARLVMRREHVLTLCANHWITPNMKLMPMKGTEKAWTWNAFDFADGEGRDQTLAVRFSLRESADAFRKIFEDKVATASSVPERGKSCQDQCDADVEILFERKPTAEQAELAGRLMLPSTFFCYRNQLEDLSDEDDDEDFEEAVKSLKGKLYPGLSIQGDASAGHDANLPWENAGARQRRRVTDWKRTVELPSVEENEEEMLFKEWAKLYRWDCFINKWKACGEGDVKILFHPSRKLYRVFMRQERDKKVCVNHCITRAIRLKPVNSLANTVAWRAADAPEGDAVLRRFAAKFKTPALAVSFTQTFKDCQSHMQTLKK